MRKIVLFIDGVICFVCLALGLWNYPKGPGVEPMYIISWAVFIMVFFVLTCANFSAAEGE